MDKKLIDLFSVFSLTVLTSFAAPTSSLEKEVRELSRAQQVSQANLLLVQEQKYGEKLRALVSKAESAKETELAQKIKDEIKLSDERIEDYKLLIKGEQKFFGIKFVAEDGQWVIVKNATTVINNWHPTDATAFKVQRVGDKICFVKDGKPVDDGWVIGENGNSLSFGGITFYRPGFKPKVKKVEAPKSETEDTPFGKRVRF